MVKRLNQVYIDMHFSTSFMRIQYQMRIEECYYIWNYMIRYKNMYLRLRSAHLTHTHVTLKSPRNIVYRLVAIENIFF